MLSRRLLRIKVVKALFAHLKSGADNMIASEKTLMASVDKAYDLYFQILTPVSYTQLMEPTEFFGELLRKLVPRPMVLPLAQELDIHSKTYVSKFSEAEIVRLIRTLKGPVSYTHLDRRRSSPSGLR